MKACIGIDPGAVRTGLVLRNGAQCLGWRVVERAGHESDIGVGPAYWGEIKTALAFLQGVALRWTDEPAFIALEGVTAPGGFRDGKRQFARPVDLLGLGATFGALLEANPGARVVAPNSHGRGMLGAYPSDLVTAGEKSKGLQRPAGRSANVSHARSAWDVAGAAIQWLAAPR